jgi:hypothetical protein
MQARPCEAFLNLCSQSFRVTISFATSLDLKLDWRNFATFEKLGAPQRSTKLLCFGAALVAIAWVKERISSNLQQLFLTTALY